MLKKFHLHDRAAALAKINQYVLDGSRLDSWGFDYDTEWIVLRGADGVKESFYIFHSEAEYNAFEGVDSDEEIAEQ